jgi:hypothetical protein
MRSTREPNWRDLSTLHDISAFQAIQVLAQIGADFSTETRDQQLSLTHDQALAQLIEDKRFAAMDASQEAVQFCDAANSLGRRLRSLKDCRPALRQAADEKREQMTPEEEFAFAARQYHRK